MLPKLAEDRSLRLVVSVGLEGGAPVLKRVRYLSEGSVGTRYVTLERRPDAGYQLESSGFGLTQRRGRPDTLSSPIRFYGFPDDTRTSYDHADWLSDLSLEVENQLGRVVYVGPLREYPRRNYLWTGVTPADVGVRGDLAVMAVLAASIAKRRVPAGQGRSREELGFEEVIASWLKKMGMIASFQVRPIAKDRREYEVRVRKTTKAPEVLITDVGFGVSQVLPVLVQAYYAKPNSTILFEQPEIHLHPRVQADLAEVFVDASSRGDVQFLIESHSEHLLRRLQRLVAEEKVPHDHVALYVCDSQAGRSEIEPLKLDPYGNITNWPKDFFGDTMADLLAMTEAAAKRSKRR